MRLMPLFAQCVMCFRTAEAQQGERSRVLNSGIIILLIPPLMVLAGIIWFAWRRNKQQALEVAVQSPEKGVRSENEDAAPLQVQADPRRPQTIPET